MKPTVMILGTGKMARNVGSLLLAENYPLIWVSRSEERLEGLKRYVNRITKRLARLSPDTFHLSNQWATLPRAREFPSPIIMETINENVKDKQDLISAILAERNDDPLVLTNSSSILPPKIHNDAIGMHFFYPAELTRFVEIIVPETRRPKGILAVDFAKDLGLNYIVQTEKTAFAGNRLLLPLQSEAMAALKNGFSSDIVNECTISPLLPTGQLQLMDSVGLDTILTSAKNYAAGMATDSARDFDAFLQTLSFLVSMGKTGQKALGSPLHLRTAVSTPENPGDLATRFHLLFVNTCLEFIHGGQLSHMETETILDRVMQGDEKLAEAKARIKTEDAVALLNQWFRQTGNRYFRPSAAWHI